MAGALKRRLTDVTPPLNVQARLGTPVRSRHPNGSGLSGTVDVASRRQGWLSGRRSRLERLRISSERSSLLNLN